MPSTAQQKIRAAHPSRAEPPTPSGTKGLDARCWTLQLAPDNKTDKLSGALSVRPI